MLVNKSLLIMIYFLAILIIAYIEISVKFHSFMQFSQYFSEFKLSLEVSMCAMSSDLLQEARNRPATEVFCVCQREAGIKRLYGGSTMRHAHRSPYTILNFHFFCVHVAPRTTLFISLNAGRSSGIVSSAR